jgi:hypothetical protein
MPKTKSAADFSAKKTGDSKGTKIAADARAKTNTIPKSKKTVTLFRAGNNQVQQIKLSAIRVNDGTQMRVVLDQDLIQEYSDIIVDCRGIDAVIPFPPVDVFRLPDGGVILANGFHRYYGHDLAGEKTIGCKVYDGNFQAALEFACGANSDHGLRASKADRRHAAEMLLSSSVGQKSDNEISKICHVANTMVAELRRSLNLGTTVRIVNKGGKVVKMDVAGTVSGLVMVRPPDPQPTPETPWDHPGAKAPEPPEVPSTHADKLYQEAMERLESVLGEHAHKVILAIKNGALGLTQTDVRDWAGSSAERVKQIMPLVVDNRFKPRRAYTIIDDEITPTTNLAMIELKAIAHGFPYEFMLDRCAFTVERLQ